MLRKAWKKGVDQFNQQRYWHAHEAWEEGWKTLDPGPLKLHVQALIQAAGSFYLLHEKSGRERGARALARAALEKRRFLYNPYQRELAGPPAGTWCAGFPEIPGLEPVLEQLVADPGAAGLRAAYSALRAEAGE